MFVTRVNSLNILLMLDNQFVVVIKVNFFAVAQKLQSHYGNLV